MVTYWKYELVVGRGFLVIDAIWEGLILTPLPSRRAGQPAPRWGIHLNAPRLRGGGIYPTQRARTSRVSGTEEAAIENWQVVLSSVLKNYLLMVKVKGERSTLGQKSSFRIIGHIGNVAVDHVDHINHVEGNRTPFTYQSMISDLLDWWLEGSWSSLPSDFTSNRKYSNVPIFSFQGGQGSFPSSGEGGGVGTKVHWGRGLMTIYFFSLWAFQMPNHVIYSGNVNLSRKTIIFIIQNW